MSAVLEDRTISMILTVPHVKELTCSGDDPSSLLDNSQPPSLPIYHASIVHIEQHADDQNKSDLIVRVPNFHHVTMPSVTITINNTRIDQKLNQHEGSIKRRAPICPVINGMNDQNKNVHHSSLTNPKRIACGLRNLRRAVVTNFRVKRTANSNRITLIPVLPDVEVIRGEFDVTSNEKKIKKTSGSKSKFLSPKILFIKRKYFKMNKKRQQQSDNSIQAQTDSEADRTNESSRANLHVKINENEQQNQMNKSDHQEINTNFTSDTEQPSNMIKDPDIRQPEIFISNSTIDFIADRTLSDQKDHNDDDDDDEEEEEDDIEGQIYIVHPNGDTYSECYEVTYEFDPEFQHFIDQNKNRINLPVIQDLSEYEDNPSTITEPSSSPPLPLNDYENIEQTSNDPNITYFKQDRSTPRVKFLNLDEFLPSGPAYEPEPISTFSFSQENPPITHLNESSLTNEDYTIILQFLKHALQLDSIPDANCNEFNKQIKEIFQKENSD